MAEIVCDILVVGASLGGTAAALRAGALGATVVLIEESGWIGGQLTAQGVCTPDENLWIESAGGTASYRALRHRIREHYKTHYTLSEQGRAQPHFNPGGCWVSRIAVEPKVAQDLLRAELDALTSVTLHLHTRVQEVESEGDRIVSVLAQAEDGTAFRFRPAYVLDGTELGDFMVQAGVEHRIGAEAQSETGEPDAPADAHPEWIQPMTVPFALERRPAGENHTITPPHDYEELKALQKYHILDGAMRGMWGELGWWTYRRVIAADQFDDPALACDIAMINTGSNDFFGGIIPTGDPARDADTIARAKRASLGYVYWLQTECPRTDDPARLGYPEFKLRGDWFETEDGVAPHPYIRESRRLLARKTILQHEIVTTDSRSQPVQTGTRAVHFPDSCGIGHYWLDIHHGGTPEPGRFFETKPFQIPLGALIPVRVQNMLAACKNLGVSHLTNGAYRLHPIEWNVGEAAGALAAFCVQEAVLPAEVLADTGRLWAFQEVLLDAGVPLYWWGDVPFEHPAFHAVQRLAMDGCLPDEGDILFHPEEPAAPGFREEIERRVARSFAWPEEPMTRADAVRLVYDSLRSS